jgi:antitoxin VapB
MDATRHVKLFRNGRNQAVRIPVEFELPGNDAIIRKDGERLIIEPTMQSGLLEWLSTIEPWDEPFLDVDEGQLPLEDVLL